MDGEDSGIDPRLRDALQGTQSFQSYPSPGFDPKAHPTVRLPLPTTQVQQPPQYTQWAPPESGYNPYYGHSSEQQTPVMQPQNGYQGYAQDAPPQSGLDGGNSESKRLRACEACRGLKVRCEPDPTGGPCKRCVKANRHCVVTPPSRKRQKKADNRVAELERKIDALTATLHATKDGQDMSGSDDLEADKSRVDSIGSTPNQPLNGQGRYPQHQQYPIAPAIGYEQNSPYTMAPTGQKRRLSEYQALYSPDNRPRSQGHQRSANVQSQKRPEFPPPRDARNEIVEQGREEPLVDPVDADTVDANITGSALVSDAYAHTLFDRYTRKMAPHMPIVVFPSSTNPETVRQTKPILFLAILSVTAGHEDRELQSKLTKKIMRVVADLVVVKGEKSLELIQAIQVVSIWYWPEDGEETKYNQLVHMAAIMAIDLGLDNFARTGKSSGLAGARLAPLETSNVDCYRAWLGCYVLCSSLTMGSRRQTFISSDTNIDDCINNIQCSNDVLPSDKFLCDYAKLQRLADGLAGQILAGKSSANIGVNTRNAQKEFEKQMRQWENQTPLSGLSKPSSLLLGHSTTRLYMHELCRHHNPGHEPVKPSRSRGKLQSQAPLSVQAETMNAALAAVLEVISNFETFGTKSLPSLPTCYLTQTAYAIVSLIRLYFATASDSDVSKSVLVSATTVKDALTELCAKVRVITAETQSVSIHDFLKTVVMLQQWFEDPKTVDSATPTVRSNSAKDDGHNQLSPLEVPAAGNRALQLLSEVATGKSGEMEHLNDNPQASNFEKRAMINGHLAELIREGDVEMIDDKVLFDIARKMST